MGVELVDHGGPSRFEMKIAILFMGLAVGAGVGLGLLGSQLGYFETAGEPVTFAVEKNENFSSLAYKLQAAGIIRHERALRWYVNFRGAGKGLRRGEFPLYKNMTVPAVVQALTQGKPIDHKLTIPEGYNLYQIADLLQAEGLAKKKDFIAAAHSAELIATLPTLSPGERLPRSLEGYLYPDTYFVQKSDTALEIAQGMVYHFREVHKELADEIKKSAVMREMHFNPHQLVVLASIVEKETGAAIERPMIASVFLNRLRKNMRLQTDPTVIYSSWMADGTWDGNIRRRDLDAPNAYNTYQMNGLPPGPISNPSRSAIEAVLKPAENDFLYFVSRGNGTHIFSKDYSAHAKAVRETQLRPKSRGEAPSSWRDLPAEQRAK